MLAEEFEVDAVPWSNCASEDAPSASFDEGPEAPQDPLSLPPTEKSRATVGSCPLGAPRDASLEHWITQICGGDETALTRLHRHCSTRVRATASRIVGNHLADEVVEDTFLQVWRSAGNFDRSRGTAMTWLITLARSRSIDLVRRMDVRGRHEVSLDATQSAHEASDEDAGSRGMETRGRDVKLRDLLEHTTSNQRNLLFMAFFEGLSHSEIAEHSGLALGTVKSHLRRSMLELRGRCISAGIGPEACR